MYTSILLVEDNPLTAKGLKYLLEREQYRVDVTSTAVQARAALDTGKYQLILLDVTLPDGDGFELAQHLRLEPAPAPLIFITARDDEDDVVRGLELGAEDYISKPFRNRELIMRIRRALSRQRAERVAIKQFGRLSLNQSTGEILLDERAINLTALERQLLTCFLETPEQVIPRKRLLDEIWSTSGSIVNDNTVSVYVKRLRAKLGTAAKIETVKHLGYRLRVGEAQKQQSQEET